MQLIFSFNEKFISSPLISLTSPKINGKNRDTNDTYKNNNNEDDDAVINMEETEMHKIHDDNVNGLFDLLNLDFDDLNFDHFFSSSFLLLLIYFSPLLLSMFRNSHFNYYLLNPNFNPN